MFLFHAVQFIKQIRFQVWKKEGILAIPKQMAFFGNAYLNVPWNSCSSSSDVFSFWLSIHCFDAIDFGFYMAFRTIETLKNSMNPNIVKNDKSQIVGFFFFLSKSSILCVLMSSFGSITLRFIHHLSHSSMTDRHFELAVSFSFWILWPFAIV